jgi:hypothetical protein
MAGRIRSIENIHLIGTQICDLLACSILPQPTMLPCAPYLNLMSATDNFSLTLILLNDDLQHYNASQSLSLTKTILTLQEESGI